MRSTDAFSVVLLALAAAACSRSTATPPTTALVTAPPEPIAEPARAAPDDCPLATETASITSVDVPNGASLVFAAPEDPAQLRAQLSTVVDTTNAATTPPDGGEARSEGGIDEPWVTVAADARIEEQDGTIAVVFTTETDVERLRTEVRQRATELRQFCPADDEQPPSDRS